jgi:hypothetical protein
MILVRDAHFLIGELLELLDLVVTTFHQLTDPNIRFVLLSEALACCPCLPPSNTISRASASAPDWTTPGKAAHAAANRTQRQEK